MFSEQEYVLVDFGAGRRLERFGPLLLDRLCPVAEGIRRGAPALWSRADARFVPQKSDSPSKNRQNASNALGFRGVWEPLTELGRQYFNAETVADASQGQRAETLSSQPWTINHAGRFGTSAFSRNKRKTGTESTSCVGKSDGKTVAGPAS